MPMDFETSEARERLIREFPVATVEAAISTETRAALIRQLVDEMASYVRESRRPLRWDEPDPLTGICARLRSKQSLGDVVYAFRAASDSHQGWGARMILLSGQGAGVSRPRKWVDFEVWWREICGVPIPAPLARPTLPIPEHGARCPAPAVLAEMDQQLRTWHSSLTDYSLPEDPKRRQSLCSLVPTAESAGYNRQRAQRRAIDSSRSMGALALWLDEIASQSAWSHDTAPGIWRSILWWAHYYAHHPV